MPLWTEKGWAGCWGGGRVWLRALPWKLSTLQRLPLRTSMVRRLSMRRFKRNQHTSSLAVYQFEQRNWPDHCGRRQLPRVLVHLLRCAGLPVSYGTN